MDFMPMFGPDSAPPASAAPDAAPVPVDGAATPLTLTGRHADGDVEVMTAHAIRYGEFLARAYAAWDQALPACWVMHDDVVMEVFALACYHDATMSCDSPGLYLPQLMASTMAALDRVRSHLAAAGGADPRHPHRMAGAASRRRRAARMDAYRLWAETDGSVPPGWDGGPGLADRLTSFDWPTTPERGAQTSGILRGALGGWRDAASAYHARLRVADDGERARVMDECRRELAAAQEAWAAWEEAERDTHERLARALARFHARLPPPHGTGAGTRRGRRRRCSPAPATPGLPPPTVPGTSTGSSCSRNAWRPRAEAGTIPSPRSTPSPRAPRRRSARTGGTRDGRGMADGACPGFGRGHRLVPSRRPARTDGRGSEPRARTAQGPEPSAQAVVRNRGGRNRAASTLRLAGRGSGPSSAIRPSRGAARATAASPDGPGGSGNRGRRHAAPARGGTPAMPIAPSSAARTPARRSGDGTDAERNPGGADSP